MQQGGSPTPFDRNMGTKMAAKTVEWFFDKLKEASKGTGNVYTDTPDSAVLLGVLRRQYTFSPLEELKKVTNFE